MSCCIVTLGSVCIVTSGDETSSFDFIDSSLKLELLAGSFSFCLLIGDSVSTFFNYVLLLLLSGKMFKTYSN